MTKYIMLLAALIVMVACGENEEKIQYTEDGWAIYAGHEWSPLSASEMTWQEAMDYCESIGGRLPNINELRKLIINCSGSAYGGTCQVSDPDCLSTECHISVQDDCKCGYSTNSYSALKDYGWIWSSSLNVDTNPSAWAWIVDFYYADVSYVLKDSSNDVRCVR